MFFEKAGPVWETLRKLEQQLNEAGIPYVIIGGMALYAHNYPRTTQDVDLVVTAEGFQRFKELFGTQYSPREGAPRRFMDRRSEAWFDFLIAGQLAGNTRKNQVIRFPDPIQAEIHNDLRTVSLPRLIELKLVTWRFKDWGDVVELIRRNQLPEALADRLHPTVRMTYLECWDGARDENYEGPQE